MKKIAAVILMIGLLFTMTGCLDHEQEYVERDTTTDMLATSTDGNAVDMPTLKQVLDVKDEKFSIECTYDIENYKLENWHVTDSKNIGMKVKTKNLPNGYEVYIDHVHADIVLKSTSPQINGITQDSMDDTCHALSQDGFYIDNSAEYYNIFSIEGYTDQFYTLWGYAFGDYGSLSSSYERLTENNILKVGTYAEKLIVVYDLSIKKPGADKLYTKSVISEILIPISQDVETVTVDGFSGEVVSGNSQ
jgi:hypothetical protein